MAGTRLSRTLTLTGRQRAVVPAMSAFRGAHTINGPLGRESSMQRRIRDRREHIEARRFVTSAMSLDALAHSMLGMGLDPVHEQTWIIVYYARFPHASNDTWGLIATHRGQALLLEVPNRAKDTANNCVITKHDAQEVMLKNMRLMGYMHTHPSDTENPGPSEADCAMLPRKYVGGVHTVGSKQVYWYDRRGVVHISHHISHR